MISVQKTAAQSAVHAVSQLAVGAVNFLPVREDFASKDAFHGVPGILTILIIEDSE